jgi:CheY-like chemotaxis protein
VKRFGEEIEVRSAHGHGATVLSSQRQLRILTVDDEPAVTKAIVRLLRPTGHLVATANSGEEAVERLGQERYDLVISDIGMGAGMNGWELAERVCRDWPKTRFVLASGWGATIDATEAREKGVMAVLTKPYPPEDLLNQVRAAARSGNKVADTASDRPSCRRLQVIRTD